LYGGDPFGQPELPSKEGEDEMEDMYGLAGGFMPGGIVTSDGKAISKKSWGALPNAFGANRGDDEDEEESSSEEEESSEEEMEESEEEDGQLEVPKDGVAFEVSRAAGMESVLPEGIDSVVPSSAIDLRKPGDETPMVNEGPKQLYTVLQQTAVDKDSSAVFASDHAYVLPGAGPGSGVPEGAASVLTKAQPSGDGKKRARPKDDEDEADELGKKFKF
jgi:splicing factor 3B subunit 2